MNSIGHFIDDISFKFLLKMFFALFVVVRTKFFVQNKRSFFHRIPLFGSLDCDMCHFSLFPVGEIQNFSTRQYVSRGTHSLQVPLDRENMF